MKSRDLCRAVPRSAAHPLSQLSETAVARYQAAYRLLQTSPKAPVCSVFRQHCGPGVCGLSTERCLPPPSAITGPELLPDTEDRKKTECLALVIAWSAREPHRVGETPRCCQRFRSTFWEEIRQRL